MAGKEKEDESGSSFLDADRIGALVAEREAAANSPEVDTPESVQADPTPEVTESTETPEVTETPGSRDGKGRFMGRREAAKAKQAKTPEVKTTAPAAKVAPGAKPAATPEVEDRSWEGTALHPVLAKKYGVKTLGEFEKRYTGSSTEAKRLQAEFQREQELGNQYREFVKQVQPIITEYKAMKAGAGQKPAAAAPAEDQFYGFASEAALNEAYTKDRIGTLAKIAKHALLTDKVALAEALKPHIQPMADAQKQREQNEQQRAVEENHGKFLTHLAGRAESVCKADPRFDTGGPLNDQLAKWWTENKSWAEPQAFKDPNWNPFEYGRRWVLAEVGQQLSTAVDTATQEKLKQTRRAAVTARPMSAGSAAPKKGDFKQSLRAIEADMALRGEADAGLGDALADALASAMPGIFGS